MHTLVGLDIPPAPPPVEEKFLSAAKLSVIGPALVASILGVYALSRPFGLTGIHGSAQSGVGYDDGILLGSAIRLIHGDFPYSSFVFLHPPGISVLMSPVAALSLVAGSSWALVVARIITVLVSIASVALVAVAVRRYGPVASTVAGLLFALFPLALNATHSLLIAPYTLFFCLVGTVLLFESGEVAVSRRVVYSGMAFGFACTVGLAALPVALVATVTVAVVHVRLASRFAASVVGIFLLVCSPFFALAPGRFINDVVTSPFSRMMSGDASLAFKIRQLSGVDGMSWIHLSNLVVVTVAIVVTVGFFYWLFRSYTQLRPGDWFIIATLFSVVVVAMVGGQLFSEQVYLPAAFVSMAAGISIGMLGRAVHFRRSIRFCAVAVGGVLGIAMLVQNAAHASTLLEGSFSPADDLEAAVPSGSCLVTDVTTYAIVADRFTSTDANCPKMVDPYGEWVVGTDRHTVYSGTYPAGFVRDFGTRMNRAEYVALVAPMSSYIPWTPELSQWFLSSFGAVRQAPSMIVYHHIKHVAPPVKFTTFVGLSSDAIVDQGLQAERLGNLDAAYGSYVTAAYRDPGNAVAHYNLGHLYQVRGMNVDAEREYSVALTIDPTFANALFNLAVMHADTDPTRAMALYRHVLELKPENEAAKFNLGVLMVRAGDENGKKLIGEVVAADPAFGQRVPADIQLG